MSENLKVVQEIVTCGWCVATHVANAKCYCETACDSPWCPMQEQVTGAHP